MDQVRIGQLIRARRENLRLTQGAVAKAVGMAKSRISQIEGGDGNAVTALGAVAAALGAQWQVYLVPAPLDPARIALLDELASMIDTLADRDVRHLSGMLRLYGDDIMTRK